jgi:hypothetical protein
VTNTGRSDESMEPMPAPLGFPRRKFLINGILAVGALAGSGVAASAASGFLRTGTGRTRVRVTAGELPFRLEFATDRGFRRFLVVAFPSSLRKEAAARYPDSILAGIDDGALALVMRCPRDRKRLGWWEASGWTMCRDCGSRFDEIGETRDGPARRGLDLTRIRRVGSDAWEIWPDEITSGLSPQQNMLSGSLRAGSLPEWWAELKSGPAPVTEFEIL